MSCTVGSLEQGYPQVVMLLGIWWCFWAFRRRKENGSGMTRLSLAQASATFCKKNTISENARKRQEELEAYWPVSFQFRPVA